MKRYIQRKATARNHIIVALSESIPRARACGLDRAARITRTVSGTQSHHHAAGLKRGDYYDDRQSNEGRLSPDEALGRSRGGFSTKIHLHAEGRGKPLALLLMAGQQHERSVFETLMETGAVKREGRGRPRVPPERVVGDKGYSSEKIRQYLHKRGIRAVIAQQNKELRARSFDREQPIANITSSSGW